MKKTVTETVYDTTLIKSPSPPQNLSEHIRWLTEKLESIPEQFRDAAKVEIEATSSYDCPSLEYSISYERPETLAEKQNRIAKKTVISEATRLREIETLNRLKAKYPTQNT